MWKLVVAMGQWGTTTTTVGAILNFAFCYFVTITLTIIIHSYFLTSSKQGMIVLTKLAGGVIVIAEFARGTTRIALSQWRSSWLSVVFLSIVAVVLLASGARMAFTNYTKQRILYHHLQGRRTPTIVKLLWEETILASRVRCFTKAIALRRLTGTSRLFSAVPDVAITRNCITLSHEVFISSYKRFPPPLLQFLSSYN